MEPEVQEAASVPRSELDTAFDVSRTGRGMVVSLVSTAPWGYELRPIHGAYGIRNWRVATPMVMSQDRQRDPYDGTETFDRGRC